MKRGTGDRLAVIGCGAAAEWIHLPALRRTGWRPAVLVDPHVERARALAEKFGALACADYAKVLDEFDTAIVSAPHFLHSTICCDLLAHGKSVLVEKPLAMTAAACDEIVMASERSGQPLGVALMRRQLGAARWVKAVLDEGRLGRIRSVDVRDGFVYRWMVASDAIWRKESAGGGVLLDVGAHVLDLLMWWLGPATRLGYQDDCYGGVEAEAMLHLDIAGGATAVVELSRTRALRQTAVIRGEDGAIEVGVDSNVLRASSERLLRLTRDGVRGVAVAPQSYDDLFDAQVRDWRRVVREGCPPSVPAREAAATVKLIEDCYTNRSEWRLPWVMPERRVG